MYFEVYKNGNLIKRGKELLEPLSWDSELMFCPEMDLVLPIDWLEYFDGREEVKVYVNDKVFWGIVWDLEPNKAEETLTVSLRHVISEWEYRQISVNHAQSDKNLNVVYKGDEVEKSTENDETITASPFNIKTNSNATNAKLISKAMAKAWVTSNGDPVKITSVKKEKQNDDNKWETVSNINSEGQYRLTYSTAKGTSVRIEISVEKKLEQTYNTISDPSVVDKLEDIYANPNFAYPGWQIDFQDGSEDEMIDYVYSKQNKLEALTQTIELTDDFFWRVGFHNEKKVEIGKFGDKKPYVISLKPSGKSNIRMITEPTIDYDFDNVINVATVYSDKSESGMASLTLREVYNDPTKQKEGFPVVILRAGVNNERMYTNYGAPKTPPKMAPSNELEFAVLDEESIALESGTLIEGSFAFNDLSPFNVDGKKITDKKRLRAAEKVYKAAIRALKEARRSYNIEVVTEELPADLEVGDKVRLIYDNLIWNEEACSSYYKKVLAYDDWFYVTRIQYEIDENEVETNTVTLAKWLKVDRETSR